MDKPTFPISIIIFISILILLFLSTIGVAIYFFYNPNKVAIPKKYVEKYVVQKAEIIGQGIYLYTIQNPDKDSDGLTDIVEEKIYNTDPKKFSTNNTEISDGESIYNIYKEAFENNNENLLTQYHQNLENYKNSIQFSTSSDQTLSHFSLNDAFTYRSLQEYNLYVGMSNDDIKIVKEALDSRLKNGNYKKSIDILQNALSKNPNSSILKYHLGLTYHGMKEYSRALDIYNSIVNDPNLRSPLLYSDIASANYGLGNDSEYIKYLMLSIKEFPKDLNQYLKLSSYYKDKNQLDKAEEVLNMGLKIEPRYAEYYNQLAIIASLKGNNKNEFDLYKKAVSYDFRYAPGHLNLSILLDQFYDNPKAALIEAQISQDLDPNSRHLSEVIILYNKIGNIKKAKELEKQLLNIKDIDGSSLNSLALMYIDQEDYKQAEFYLRKAIVIMPELSNAYNNLGIVLLSTNRIEEAGVNFNKAIEINPNYANAYSNLGIYYTDKKQYAKAIESFEKASSINPSLWRPYQAIAYVYRMLNDNEKEKFYYKKAIEFGCKDPAVIERLRILEK